MPDPVNSLGVINVGISADATPLTAALASAQSKAAQAGTQISAAFNGAVGPIKNVTGATLGLDAAAASAAASTNVLAGSLAKTGAAAHASITPIQATGGAIRVALGEQSIRAVERFLTLIPNLAPLLTAAFPLIGAIALGSAVIRAVDKSEELKKSIEALAAATKKADEDFAHLVLTIDQLGEKSIGREFGPAAEARARSAALKAEAADALQQVGVLSLKLGELNKQRNDHLTNPGLFIPGVAGQIRKGNKADADAIRQEIEGLNATIIAKQAEAADALKSAGKTALEDTGRYAAQTASEHIAALARRTRAEQQHADAVISLARETAQAEIDALHDPQQRALDAARADVIAAQAKANQIIASETALTGKTVEEIRKRAAAEALGRTPLEQRAIGQKTTAEVSAAREDLGTKIAAATDAVTLAQEKQAATNATVAREYEAIWNNVIREQFEKLTIGWREAEVRVSEYFNRLVEAQVRVIEIQDRAQGVLAASKIEGDKLRAEREFGEAVLHTARERIAQAQKLADLDSRARQEKIAGLAKELSDVPDTDDPAHMEKRAQLEAQIAELRAKANNDDIAAQTRISELIREQTFEYKAHLALIQAARAIPGAIGGGIAAGVFGGGKSIGEEVAHALKNVGQQLFGQLLTAAIEKLIAEIILNTLGQAVLNTVMGTSAAAHTAATAANTTALSLNTLALHKASLAAASGGGGGAGATASNAAGAAASGALAPIIGGVISGVLSIVGSLIAAHQIVAAVNRTTAAIQALHGTVATGPATPGLSASASAPEGGQFGFLSSLLGLGGSGKPVDVNIVSFNLKSPLSTGIHPFGFAEGGRPGTGIPRLIGERGPELFVPDVPGTIFPAGSFGKGGDIAYKAASSSSSDISGDLHFHAHGIQSPREHAEMALKVIPQILKTRSSSLSNYSR